MASEYEIRCEALRAASSIGLTGVRGILEAAERFADWLRDGDWAENAPDTPDVSGFTPTSEETAPASVWHACTCTHPKAAHTAWDGCTAKYGDVDCGCVWSGTPSAPEARARGLRCTRCSHLHLPGTHTCGIPLGSGLKCECKGAPA